MLRDIRHAVRSLRRWRLGAFMAIATLAIGIGTATSLYAFLRPDLRVKPDSWSGTRAAVDD
jgi:hypothetical protein